MSEIPTRPADRPTTPRRARPAMRASAVLVALGLALVAAACGSSGRSASGTPSTDAGSGAGTGGTATTVAIAPGATVDATFPPQTATVSSSPSDLGTILVDGTGRTLYVYLADAPGVPSCTGDCAKAWPPVTGNFLALANTVPRQPGEFKLVPIPGSTAQKQAAVGGRPLYRFAGDDLAGETKGQGLDGKWYVVGTDGQPITKAAPATTSTTARS